MAIIRHALLALIDVAEDPAGILRELRLQRRRYSPALGVNMVARSGWNILIHRREASGQIPLFAVGIHLGAITAAGDAADGAIHEAGRLRQLRDGVDRAAGRAAAEGKSRWSLV